MSGAESELSSKSEPDSGSKLGSASPEGVELWRWQRIRNIRSQKQRQTWSQDRCWDQRRS